MKEYLMNDSTKDFTASSSFFYSPPQSKLNTFLRKPINLSKTNYFNKSSSTINNSINTSFFNHRCHPAAKKKTNENNKNNNKVTHLDKHHRHNENDHNFDTIKQELEDWSTSIQRNKESIAVITNDLKELKSRKSQTEKDIQNLISRKESLEVLYNFHINDIFNWATTKRSANGLKETYKKMNNITISLNDIKECGVPGYAKQVINMLSEMNIRNVDTYIQEVVDKHFDIFNTEVPCSRLKSSEIINNFFNGLSSEFIEMINGNVENRDNEISLDLDTLILFLKYWWNINRIDNEWRDKLKKQNVEYQELKATKKNEMKALMSMNERLENTKEDLQQFQYNINKRIEVIRDKKEFTTALDVPLEKKGKFETIINNLQSKRATIIEPFSFKAIEKKIIDEDLGFCSSCQAVQRGDKGDLNENTGNNITSKNDKTFSTKLSSFRKKKSFTSSKANNTNDTSFAGVNSSSRGTLTRRQSMISFMNNNQGKNYNNFIFQSPLNNQKEKSPINAVSFSNKASLTSHSFYSLNHSWSSTGITCITPLYWKDAFCYFRLSKPGQAQFHPIHNYNNTPEEVDFFKGFISYDHINNIIKFQPRIDRNEHLTNNDWIIKSDSLTGVSISSLMKNVWKIHMIYRESVSQEEDIPNMWTDKIWNCKNVKIINDLDNTGKIKAMWNKWFPLDFLYNKRDSIECVFLDYNSFRHWYEGAEKWTNTFNINMNNNNNNNNNSKLKAMKSLASPCRKGMGRRKKGNNNSISYIDVNKYYQSK